MKENTNPIIPLRNKILTKVSLPVADAEWDEERFNCVDVISLGCECRDSLNIKVGDKVLVCFYAGSNVSYKKTKYLIIDENDIFAKIEN